GALAADRQGHSRHEELTCWDTVGAAVSMRDRGRSPMSVITNIEDLRALAERRVPRMFYDYADSGSWTESTYRANESDFAKIKLRQRVAVNLEQRSVATRMIGEDVSMPVALAPTGMTGMQHA